MVRTKKQIEDWHRVLDEKINLLNAQIKGCDADMEDFKKRIDELRNKKMHLKFEKAHLIDEWQLSTLKSLDNKWEGKRRPTGFK